ncbi:unnamed protein product [Cuscuta epithymum]|uniref:Uncharacterized protein n=1 Tax=Cuscuta epithymum TaxID=186058 RepID=A0AAV0E2K8_9ASTE|nr:unnamed protein product [Cuscuta epithymum]
MRKWRKEERRRTTRRSSRWLWSSSLTVGSNYWGFQELMTSIWGPGRAEKTFGVGLRAGGRVKTSPTGVPNRWLSSEASNSGGYGFQRKADLREDLSTESKTSMPHQNEIVDKEETSGDTQRGRIWDNQAKEDTSGEGMALGGPKNGEAAGQSS